MSKYTRARGACLGLMIYAAAMSVAHAAVDVNTGNESALETISGIGTSKARAIVKERESNGPFKDADDLAARISGLGPKSIARLKDNGLTIGGVGSSGGATGANAGNGAAGANGTSGATGNGAGAGSAAGGAASTGPSVAAAKGAGRGAQSARK